MNDYFGQLVGLQGSADGFRFYFEIDFIAVISYVLLALGLYTIAKRRGIKNPWLAWIPVANVWVLGCISDQYQYVVNGLVKSKRKVMLTLQIILVVAQAVLFALVGFFLISLFGQADLEQMLQNPVTYIPSMMEQLLNDSEYLGQLMGWSLGILATCVVLIGVAISLAVMQYTAYYDLFASCDPANKVLFLVLGIVMNLIVGNILMAVFVFICRKKELGMPPRKQDPDAQIPPQQPQWQSPQPEQPAWQPTQPQQYEWQPPQPEQPAWQPTQPQKEPWEQSEE